MIKLVIFRRDGQKIMGMLHIPHTLKREHKAPAIVMFHGFTGNKTEAHRLFVHVARSLCDQGYVVLRFDFLGSGESDGEFEDMTLPYEVSDAEEAIRFLTKQRLVDTEKIGVLGLSMGGRVAAILALKDRRVKFAVLYSPALGCLKDRWLQQIDAQRNLFESGKPIEVTAGWYLKKAFFDTIDNMVPLVFIDQVKIPILIIHGDHDSIVPVEESAKGYELVKKQNPKNEFHIVEGADHTFSQKIHTIEAIEKTKRWLSNLNLDD